MPTRLRKVLRFENRPKGDFLFTLSLLKCYSRVMTIVSSRVSIVALVVANLMPLLGVLYFSWNLFAILLLFWLENAVIGFYTLLKIAKATAPAKSPIRYSGIGGQGATHRRGAYFAFFFVHYGMFTFVHGIFVFQFFRDELMPEFHLGIALLGLLVSHGLSYYLNFVGRGEFKNVSPDKVMFSPYKRVVVMHLTILLGGMIVMATGISVMSLFVLVGVKILIDIGAHLFEHKKS